MSGISILKLEIENYKQFAGEHEIAFPEHGAIAVIGHNGAGKTTLFEAIEWCLYGKVGNERLRNDDLLPRQATGKVYPRVAVTLQTGDGQLYRVERQLRGGVKATINDVSLDGDLGEMITDGRDKVTDYITTRLIGLSHDAFCSTFFTRQKELSFFGDMKNTDRRREVGKLLGHETIRTAQEVIAEDRKSAKLTANQYRFKLEEIAGDRDLDAERTIATGQIELTESAVTEATTREATCQRDMNASQQAEDHWRGLQAQDLALKDQLARHDQAIATADERVTNITAQLARLDQREAELAGLRPVADREVELQGTVDRWTRERERDQQRARLIKQRDQLDREREATIANIQRIAREPIAVAIPGWEWQSADAQQPATATVRLAGVAGSLDVQSARSDAERVTRAFALTRELVTADRKVASYTTRLGQLRQELDRILAQGDPDEQVRQANMRVIDATNQASSAGAQAKNERTEASKLRKAIAQLQQSGEGECPTCRRPINDSVIHTLSESIAQREENATLQEQIAVKARTQADMAQRDEAAARQVQENVTKTRESIRNGEGMTDEAQQEWNTAQANMNAALSDAGLIAPPSEDAVVSAQQRFETYQHVATHAARLADFAQALSGRDTDAAEIAAELQQIGQVNYDPAAHEQANRELGSARQAIGQIREIEGELARRPEHHERLTQTRTELETNQQARTALTYQRGEVGYDEPSHVAATQHTRAAQLAFNEATNALHHARNHHDAALRGLGEIDAVEREMADTKLRATDADAEHDLLDRMYTGFNEFEKWVAQRMNPHLADRAGELLREVTEGKYDQVRFDDDYGLHVYDGDEDFPVAQFSGGERDVASLCARLALSKIIGAQAAHPPAFIVLDEVFGSLDQERRQNLLSTLDVLTGDEVDGFRQLFIISHVDDIRNSQAFDHVWKISESHGTSRWETIPIAGGAEEL